LALAAGTRLGAYEVTAQIGAGGMGEVYRATDTKLKRQVAIKVLPPSFAADADRLVRFQREAEVLASLNHPNIAQIYGLEEGPAEAGHHVRAIVMELVEGETLEEKIRHGSGLMADGYGQGRSAQPSAGLPLDEVLHIAKQIADALEAAHEHGIVHRDLKPANIKVREDGVVKVLDFGLAKATGPAEAGHHDDPRGVRLQADLTQSPTLTTPAMLTGAGMILGTAAYMSPEQARGKTVDKRADVWAFGCVLFEMLTGERAFAGDDVSDVLASVLAREPDWARLPPSLPPALGTYLRRCLHKDPRQRIHDIADVRLALEGAFEGAATPIPPLFLHCGCPRRVRQRQPAYHVSRMASG
jgi:serine/threonine protein kinase